MIPTPQTDEALNAIAVGVDVADNVRDKLKAGKKIGFGDIVSAIITANGPILDGINDSDKIGGELTAALQDRETMGRIGQQIGYKIHDIAADLRDPNR